MNTYLGYATFSLARLAIWMFLICVFMGLTGFLVYHCVITALNRGHQWLVAGLAAFSAIGVISSWQFLNQLLYIPASLMASFNYRGSRLYPLWEQLTPERVAISGWVLFLMAIAPVAWCLVALAKRAKWVHFASIAGATATLAGLPILAGSDNDPSPVSTPAQTSRQPNIVMIGSDTLRADRIGANGYYRPLTPHIDALARKGANFEQCIVPLGRTGPSMVSLLTSTWPSTHGVRDNYVGDDQLTLPMKTLPQALKEAGYVTAAVADWAGSDLSKFGFGFDLSDTSPDQWNLKYLLRQGPKDIRLFLSLFTHNRFGKTFLPEIYYLAGVPLTAEVGRDSRRTIKELANNGKPFLVDIFTSATHGPFGSPFPYYTLYTDPKYRGDSLFSMSDVSSVEDVLKAQEAGKQHFDVQQIINLYDGAVKSFDDEVGKIVDFLNASGLGENTIVVIYSDHGVDLFEGETWGQGNIVSDFSHRVPLIIYDPRRASTGNITKTVRSVDVAPTLLQLTGTPIPASMQGASLLPFLEHGNEIDDRIAFAETGIWISKVRGLPKDRITYPSVLDLLEIKGKESGTLSVRTKYMDVIVQAKSRLARQGQWALVYFPLQNGESYSLYDIKADKEMRHDVIEQNPEVAVRLKSAIVEWMQVSKP